MEHDPSANIVNPINPPRRKVGLKHAFQVFIKRRLDSYKRGANAILSGIPGTRPFNDQLKKEIIHTVRNELNQFRKLSSIDKGTKKSLFPSITKDHLTIIQGNIVPERIFMPFYMIFFLILISCCLLVPQFIVRNYYIPNTSGTLWWLSNIFGFVLASIVKYAPIFITIAFFIKYNKRPDKLPIFVMFIWPTVISLIEVSISLKLISNLSTNISEHEVYALSSLISSSSYWIFGAGIGISALVAERRISIIRRYNKSSVSAISVKLLHILERAEETTASWKSLSNKREIIKQLEEVAVLFELYIYRKLKTNDLATNIWLQDMTSQIAASFRDLKKWVYLSNHNTQEEFRKIIVDSILYINMGWWDCLRRVEVEQVAPKNLWRYRLILAIRTIFVALLPLLILGLIQQTPVALQPETADYITIGGGVWALLTTLAALDPLFSAKVAAFKDVVNTLPFFGKGP